jgi:hypothetical protein
MGLSLKAVSSLPTFPRTIFGCINVCSGQQKRQLQRHGISSQVLLATLALYQFWGCILTEKWRAHAAWRLQNRRRQSTLPSTPKPGRGCRVSHRIDCDISNWCQPLHWQLHVSVSALESAALATAYPLRHLHHTAPLDPSLTGYVIVWCPRGYQRQHNLIFSIAAGCPVYILSDSPT